MVKSNYIFNSLIVITIAIVTLLMILPNIFNHKDKDTSLTVITTIFPLTDITKQIAGPNINVIQLIPSNSSPHSFNLSPKQISNLSKADIIFSIGHGLDDFAVNSAQKIKIIPNILASNNIELNRFNHHDNHNHDSDSDSDSDKVYALTIDPHYWLSVPNAQIIANTIATSLIDLDPTNEETYKKNLAKYQSQLEELEKELQKIAKESQQKSFIAIHNAWSYFEQQYNLDLVAVYETTEGKQPSVKDIQNIGKIIEANKLTAFFTEPQKQSDSSSRLMQQEYGLTIKVLDPIGGTIDNDSYIKLMLRNMKSITGTKNQTDA